MNVKSGEIEFRPLDRAWENSPHNWRLFFSLDDPSQMIQCSSGKQRLLVDIRSDTFKRISDRIGPLEYPEFLTVSYNKADTFAVSIDLPRLRLSFSLNNGELESKNMHDMIIDRNQSIGTMVGLTNRLILCHKESTFASLPRSRYVLISHGEVKFSLSPDENHVDVNIDTHTKRQVTWYKYEIDSDLGLLVGSVNLTSRLYRIYLHALCSCYLPDPLTSQTGTNHALQELNAAASFSFQSLTDADVKLLELISKITPRRKYYPEDICNMQTIEWSSNLPVLSQHDAFDTIVQEILEHARSLAIFEPKNKGVSLDYKSDSNLFLMERAMQRNAVYYEEAIVDIPPDSDYPYSSLLQMTTDGIEASNTSRLVYAWPKGLTCDLGSTELLEAFKEWRYIDGPKPGLSLTYSQDWLHLNLPATWISLYNLCRQIRQDTSKKFELVFSFAALAYAVPDFRKFIPVLLAIASIPDSSFVGPPKHSSYCLTDGFEPRRDRVRKIVNSGTLDFKQSPAGSLSPHHYETKDQFFSRKSRYYEDNTQRRISDAVDSLMNQWPTPTPSSPFGSDHPRWFNTAKIMEGICEYFDSCSRNVDLRSFTSGVTTELRENHIKSPLIARQILEFSYVPQFNVSQGRFLPHTLKGLLSTVSAPVQPTHEFGVGAPRNCMIDTSNLKNLISRFRDKNNSKLSRLYIDRLENSRKELQGPQTPVHDCLVYRNRCRSSLSTFWSLIHTALSPATTMDKILADLGLWPRIHPRTTAEFFSFYG